MRAFKCVGMTQIAVFGLVALFIAESASGESILIKRKFESGSKHLFETKTGVTQVMSGLPGMPTGQEMEMKFDSLLCRQEVIKDGKMGKKEVTSTFDHWAHDWDFMGNELQYDSDDPDNEEAAPMISSIFSEMVGESYKYEVSRDGKVMNFSGMDEIVEKIDKKASMNMFWPQMKSQYTNEAGRRQFAEDPLLIYPNKKVSVGDSWTATSSEDRPQIGKIKHDYTYKLEKIATENGRKVAIISYTADVSGGDEGAPPSEGEEKGGGKTEVKGTITGKAVYDVEQGLIVSDKSENKTSVKVPASKMGGSGEGTVSFKTLVSSDSRLISEKDRARQKSEVAAKIAARKAAEEAEEDDDYEDEDDEDDDEDEDDE